jgi:ATP-dependent RNA circularization protein (DNA/RNA ligase family)
MSELFRFPHTPHLAWLAEGSPRDDKVLSGTEAKSLLSGDVVIEEKLDGANLGISMGPAIRVQNRGQYLIPPFSGQFTRVSGWLASHEASLREHLTENLILFGEWCTARHSLDYETLPDWFLGFDIYDRNARRFWSTKRRNALLEKVGTPAVPLVFHGQTDLGRLRDLVLEHSSAFRNGSLEGLVIRKENNEWLEARAKLVHPNFTQAIDEHWSRRRMEWNHLASCP